MRRQSRAQDFEISWHPYFLDVTLPTEGLDKREFYRAKGMGDAKLQRVSRCTSEPRSN
jgi:predicted DsbA family dithiol-disulfide isomerase